MTARHDSKQVVIGQIEASVCQQYVSKCSAGTSSSRCAEYLVVHIVPLNNEKLTNYNLFLISVVSKLFYLSHLQQEFFVLQYA